MHRTRKLTLARETIRQLTNLAAIRGGLACTDTCGFVGCDSLEYTCQGGSCGTPLRGPR